ncbi:MAG TPA: extracellular matrix/biofilm biosynthesis regulator RemA family protein [Pseudoneobacillus sp.]|jgi:extracellular matrix regulatory protein B|nr:extracellular matrix/biofilm biosynthesis regulator RemA family protein [Pseudoneobacillus sp.]
MYIHIGDEVLVKTKDIIAILDKDSVHSSDYIQEYLQHNEHNTENLSKNSFKSIVITSGKIYLSPLASTTLKKRSMQLYVMDH